MDHVCNQCHKELKEDDQKFLTEAGRPFCSEECREQWMEDYENVFN